MRSGEFATISRLKERFHVDAEGVIIGIGDDAAVLDPSTLASLPGRLPHTPSSGVPVPGPRASAPSLAEALGEPPWAAPRVTAETGEHLAPGGRKLVWTIDEQVEKTHFRRELAGFFDVGWRSFMAAASDLAAMGAEPWCALSALSLPADFDDEDLDALTRGQHAAAVRLGTSIVGGNLTRGEVVTVATSLLGTAERPMLRRGARAGDGIWIAGRVGLAAAGLLALERGIVDEAFEAARDAWLRPWARIAEGRHAAKRAHALVAVSDGLAQDAGHVAEASEVRAIFDEEALRDHAHRIGLDGLAELVELEPLELMLGGGEDYALVAASDVPLEGFWRAGTFEAGQGIALRQINGRERELLELGYDHFRMT